MPEADVKRTIDAIWRIESARLIAGLARIVRDVGLAEDLAQEAFVAALEQWPESGVPERPGAWLMATAKHRAIDRLRRANLHERKLADLLRELERSGDRDPGPHRRRSAAADIHDVPSRSLGRCAGGADAAAPWRADHR